MGILWGRGYERGSTDGAVMPRQVVQQLHMPRVDEDRDDLETDEMPVICSL